MDYPVKLITWMFRAPKSLDRKSLLDSARAAAGVRVRFLAGVSWMLLVVGGAACGAFVGDYSVSAIHGSIAGELAALIIFCLSFLVGMLFGAVLWVQAMRVVSVSEDVIKVTMLRGPFWA